MHPFPAISIVELQDFRQIIDDFIKIAEGIVSEVEEEKLHAIGAMNILKSMAKQKETRQQDIQVNIPIPHRFCNYQFFNTFGRIKLSRKLLHWNN